MRPFLWVFLVSAVSTPVAARAGAGTCPGAGCIQNEAEDGALLQVQVNRASHKIPVEETPGGTCFQKWLEAYNASESRPDCKCLSYPKTVKEVFNRSDAKYLEELFFNKLHTYEGHYYLLWRHLNETRDPTVFHILQKLNQVVETHFGSDFVIIDDFYSLRQDGYAMFPSVHQDTMFWSTGKRDCDGFNLWILLNHNDYNRSFEVWDIDKNPSLYEGIDFYSPRTVQYGIWTQRMHENEHLYQPTRTPLSIGEALVIKEVDIHHTEDGSIPVGQWRLGIGFKVMKKLPLLCAKDPSITVARDPNSKVLWEDPRLPGYEQGTMLWSPYDPQLLRDYWSHF
jgi:hypothetical protein